MVCKNTRDNMRKGDIFSVPPSASSCDKPNAKTQEAIKESRILMAAHRARFPNGLVSESKKISKG